MTPEHARNYIRKVERGLALNSWRWQASWARKPLEAAPEPWTPPNQEDHVYLREVLTALLRRSQRGQGLAHAPALVLRFVENCDMVGRGDRPGSLAPLPRAEVQHAIRARRWLRAWARVNA